VTCDMKKTKEFGENILSKLFFLCHLNHATVNR